MTDRDWSRFGDEIAQLHASRGDPELAALEAAIYLEDAAGIRLPDQLLQSPALRTVEGTRSLLDELGESR